MERGIKNKMQGTATELIHYMEGSDKHFVIPVYQRNYDWKQENCKQLFDDLVKVIRRKLKSHFFGCIVSAHCDGTFNDSLIIDGQQRLTTVSLIFLAMYNLIRSGVVSSEQTNLADEIYERFLINKWQDKDKRIRLKHVKGDQEAFSQLFVSEDEHIKDSRITENYEFFCEQIKKELITVDQLYEAIKRLEIINISLADKDDPQLIFESLNSTGLALSEGDKIRNFILMGLSVDEQNEYYEKYWNRIEKYTSFNVSAFIRDYLSVKQQAIPAVSKVYLVFKAYVEEEEIVTEDLLKDMLSYAKRYQMLLEGRTSDKALDACIYRLNRLETTVTRPFFLEVLRMEEEHILTLKEVRDIFLCTENYLFRRTVCDLQTNALNKIFLMLHRDIIRFDGTPANYTEKFKYVLLNKKARGEFPKDDEFVEAFSQRQVYQMNSKNKIYIFERFENGGTLEDNNIYRHWDDGSYSIEHIMPQHLTSQWKDALGPDYEDIHELWLHKLANLTLTAYNSSYSNNSFTDKRDKENGFCESGIRMNKWISQQEEWTERELEARNNLLMKKALEIWPLPKSDYAPEEKPADSCTLDDDIDLRGKRIQKFEYKSIVKPVSGWINMEEQVLKILHEKDRSVLSRLAHIKDAGNQLITFVSDDPAELREAMYIDKEIYVERNTGTNTKISFLRKLFKAYDENPEDLVFYLRDSEGNIDSEETAPRHILRKKYWTYALKYLHEAHGPNGTFANANPPKDSWLGGSFGVSGFYISCVFNYSEARVELVMSKSNKELNKAAYDYLLQQKKEIESRLGMQLEWRRSDETKTSYAVCRLNEVSITKEADWPKAARFHAEQSKKFYDVFVPLLETWSSSRSGK